MKDFFLFGTWVIVGLIIFAFSLANWFDSYHFRSNSLILDAEVIGSKDTDGQIFTKAPVVRFSTPSGKQQEYRYDGFFGSEEYSIGDKVKVFYNPVSGQIRLDDYNQLYLTAHLLAFFSFIILSPIIAGAIIYLWLWGLPTKCNIKATQQK